ncbi:hypothetical protein HYX15_03655 [Candidatus Woesearchaeota archaeon]|nr:hypothetical protein [Candidatus Woesearchaeota archaeon]
MRTGLIIFGVVFLVFGVILYLMPTQTAEATKTTVGDGGRDTFVSYGSIEIPWPISLGLAIAGLILLIFGLIIPDSHRNYGSHNIDDNEEYSEVIETRKSVESDGGRKRREIRETRKQKR